MCARRVAAHGRSSCVGASCEPRGQRFEQLSLHSDPSKAAPTESLAGPRRGHFYRLSTTARAVGTRPDPLSDSSVSELARDDGGLDMKVRFSPTTVLAGLALF